jgi:hypothetical protein
MLNIPEQKVKQYYGEVHNRPVEEVHNFLQVQQQVVDHSSPQGQLLVVVVVHNPEAGRRRELGLV